MEEKSKIYGIFSINYLRGILSLLEQLPGLTSGTNIAARENPENLSEIFTPNYSWVEAYNFTLFEQSKKLLILLQNDVDSEKLQPHNMPLEVEIADEIKEPKLFYGMWTSLVRNIQAIEVYGYPINHYLKLFEESGDDKHIFKVIKIDHSLVAHPLILDRISMAEILDEHAFFNKLSNAIKSRAKKTSVDYYHLRYLLYLLHESESLDCISTEDQYELFCVDLELYPADSADPSRSLQKFIERWKKELTT